MKVIINGQLIEQITTINALNEVITDLRIQCAKENLVMQMMVNGLATDNILPGLSESELDTVEIQLLTPEEMVVEGIVEGYNYLPRFVDGLNQCLDYFRAGNQSQAVIIFGQAVDGMNFLNHVFSGIKFYILPLEEFNQVRTTYQTQIAGFEQVLKELMETWENEDYVLMADLIEFELIPQLEQVQEQFHQILDRLIEVE